MTILLATSNVSKQMELYNIMKEMNIKNLEIKTLKDFPSVIDSPEDGETFLSNAYQKVMYYYNIFKMPCICDDTGLCVDYLNGAPGVRTARYGSIDGSHTDPSLNRKRILSELEGISNRSAHFSTAMYFYDGSNLVSSYGSFYGSIATIERGSHGFGYDPIMLDIKSGKTLAELDVNEKNHISHRFHATSILLKQLINYHII